ncbi:Ca-activated chloride channel homolog [Mariprofundus micogutta]|uniref:Ca-activated chloride channel homolog n=1 Tax=Mariprofundus micogutta TaxID=1921010 RepID=A0A1L8CMI2_9PROT|nr:VWA domain-containing protein [Mariprofundus micogutta]GAV20117.1 Ca-activated chloride channel homolog [Mariprofundus micogutta]
MATSLSLTSISLEFLWALLLLPLPLLVRFWMPPVSQSGNVAWVPFASELEAGDGTKPTSGSSLRLALAVITWLLLVLAAARPEWQGDAVELPVSGRDLLLAVDISGSMQTQDFVLSGRQTDRLTATKAVANAFIKRREGDRIGLILFGSKAYVQTPLTFDRDTVSILMNEAVIGLAGEETAIGDAIGLAVKRLKQGETAASTDQVLILLTDGVNTAGVVSPDQAAELAVKAGLTIYTIGIGADAMIVRSFFGNRQVNPSAQLDEKTLTQIAELTGGKYFRARDTEALQQIYRIIDKLEPVEKDAQMFRPRHALFMWPLGLALMLTAGLLLSMTPVVRRR